MKIVHNYLQKLLVPLCITSIIAYTGDSASRNLSTVF